MSFTLYTVAAHVGDFQPATDEEILAQPIVQEALKKAREDALLYLRMAVDDPDGDRTEADAAWRALAVEERALIEAYNAVAMKNVLAKAREDALDEAAEAVLRRGAGLAAADCTAGYADWHVLADDIRALKAPSSGAAPTAPPPPAPPGEDPRE